MYCCRVTAGSTGYLEDFFSGSFRFVVDDDDDDEDVEDSGTVSRCLEELLDDVGLRTIEALDVGGFSKPHWARLS